jgi:hypothetical protein
MVAFFFMNIDIVKLKGYHVYLEELRAGHIPVLKVLAKDERIWEFTRTLLINDTFDSQFENYIQIALDPNGDGTFGVGLQKTFVIHRKADSAIIGMIMD